MLFFSSELCFFPSELSSPVSVNRFAACQTKEVGMHWKVYRMHGGIFFDFPGPYHWKGGTWFLGRWALCETYQVSHGDPPSRECIISSRDTSREAPLYACTLWKHSRLKSERRRGHWDVCRCFKGCVSTYKHKQMKPLRLYVLRKYTGRESGSFPLVHWLQGKCGSLPV